jgi:DNA-binding cell septation regulator SpoVG
LNTVLEEIDKLERVIALGLPAGLFADCSEKLIAAWRARAAAAYPSDLRAMPQPIRLTLLAVLCWSRTAEITDSLVDLLIEVVHKIRAHAENKVDKELVADLKRVRGKQGLLFALAEAAVEHPDDTVRTALFPIVSETSFASSSRRPRRASRSSSSRCAK